MATWKERGEVPDSDDDEDIESQDLQCKTDAQSRIENTSEQVDHEASINYDNDDSKDFQNDTERRRNGIRSEGKKIHIASPTSKFVSTGGSSPLSVLSSQTAISGFQVPDLEGVLDEEVEQSPVAQESSQELVLEDGISRSYVQITSRASLRQLSPIESLPEFTSVQEIQHGSQRSSRGSNGTLPEFPSLQSIQHDNKRNTSDLHNDQPVQDLREIDSPLQQAIADDQNSYPMKRALRHRNAIQLHPYVVENEKYRRTLKARGIAPMRLDSSPAEPQHAPRRSPTPDPDFQQEDTPGVGMDVGESQAMDFEYTIPPASPARPSESREDDLYLVDHDPQARNRADDSNDDEDEDFPDIDELLRSRNDASIQVLKKVKRRGRPKSYSHKFKRPVLPRIMTQSSKPKPLGRHNKDIFDLPASPPTTSSPQATTLPRRISTSGRTRSLELSPSWLSQEETYDQRTPELPTPSTSALKPQTFPIQVDSDSEDPFATDVASEKGDYLSSSSDETVQIRQITKKFRGVLPASHLRLDMNRKQQELRGVGRYNESVSPVKSAPLRGVARPRAQSGVMYSAGSPSARTDTAFPTLSDDSDEDTSSGFIIEKGDDDHLKSLFDESRMGYAEEDDKIDAMLPPRKHLSMALHRPKKKRKLDSSSLHRTGSSVCKRQAKITDHIEKAPRTTANGRPKSTHPRKNKKKRKTTAPVRSRAPAVGLLDVLDMLGTERTQPNFIRIAARAARSRTMQGRHEPTGKFFRLATREDTEDVQSVLKDWASGKFHPKELPSLEERSRQMSQNPLSHVDYNQTHLRLAQPRIATTPKVQRRQASQAIRKLPVNRRQQSLNDFVQRENVPPTPSRPAENYDQSALSHEHIPQRRPRGGIQPARPAQLEALEVEYIKRYPSTTFKSSKRALDALYRKTRKQPMPSTNLQLTRFLADEDIILPSVEQDTFDPPAPKEVINIIRPQSRSRVLGRRKPLPRRVDVGAAVYRQPSDPLILSYLIPQFQQESRSGSKLIGLAKFGEKYPQNFDILPLPSGVFFHASTFIGSGRLFQLMSLSPSHNPDHASPTTVFVSLDQGKTFSWGQWDENVSSEIGLCFDWLVDQSAFDDSRSVGACSAATLDVVKSLCDYVQRSMVFDGLLNETTFLSRMLEILKDFSTRFQVDDLTQASKVKLGIQVLSMVSTITFRLLLIARSEQQCSGLAFGFEDVLKTIASNCAKLLLSKDMSILHKLYDDLQYLSFRDNGIRSDQYVVEGWVVLIKILTAARIPRGSFWDIVNVPLSIAKIGTTTDAPAMERIWYEMFTLIPLCEFNEYGVVQDFRHYASFDNWQLPQQLLKRVFHLYTNNPRQSPGFNDYCRALIGRCHYLMVQWRWWNCSAIIGTLFDFFATHNLAHLRNEEVYASPSFLTELAFSPNLSIEPEDRCFHIFLKIVALALKRFSFTNNLKSAGNLVARLQPNHNRHFPKEESIHQGDLASLRNHHDLLCTLFWAAPRLQRPSLHTIEHVIDVPRSHAEVVEIHNQGRRNLANFLYSTNSNTQDLIQMAEWMERSIRGLFNQYEAIAEDVRADASGLCVTEHQIEVLVDKNKTRILCLIKNDLNHWKDGIEVANSLSNAAAAFNAGLVLELMDHIRRDPKHHTNGLLEHGVVLIDTYLKKIEKLRPSNSAVPSEDSQNSLSETDVYTLDVIETLKNVHHQFALLTHDSVKTSSEIREVHKMSMRYMLDVWASMVIIFIDAETHNVGDYFDSGKYDIFKNLESLGIAVNYWPHFAERVVSFCSDANKFKPPEFSIERIWILRLAAPCVSQQFEDSLTKCLASKGFPLCGYMSRLYETGSFSATAKIKAAIMGIEEMYYPGGSRPTSSNADRLNELQSFNTILNDVEILMQEQLEGMVPHSKEHLEYLKKVREIVSCIATYTSNFRPMSKYYSETSRCYWPLEDDPFQFSAYLGAYCRDLHREPSKTAQKLFYFLCNSWNAHLQADHLDLSVYAKHVLQWLKFWSLLKFMLADFLPIIIEASFESDCSALWITLIEPVVRACEHVLCFQNVDNLGECDTYETKEQRAKWVCGAFITILMQMVNKIQAEGPSRYYVRTAYRTWTSIQPLLRVYLAQTNIPGIKDTMTPILRKLDEFGVTDGILFRDWEFHIVDAAFGNRITYLNRSSAVKDAKEMAERSWRVHTTGRDMTVRPVVGQPVHIIRMAEPQLVQLGGPDEPRAWGQPFQLFSPISTPVSSRSSSPENSI